MTASVAPSRALLEPGVRDASPAAAPAGRPRWWVEVLVIAVLYGAYSLVRNSVGDVATEAHRNAEAILRVEDSWQLAVERGLNSWVHSVESVAAVVALHYATLHFLVTPALLVWLYRRRAASYRMLSSALMATTGLALVGFFLMPTAPPRLMPHEGFVDVMSQTASWGWWPTSGAPGSDAISNQFAAMPSLHCAWAAWCGITLVLLARRTWVRVVGGLYPASTVFVVLGSGNHFLLDVVAGLLVLAAGSLAVLGVRHWVRTPAGSRSLVV